MKQKTDERLQSIKIKYGKINIEDKKFIVPILELLHEFKDSPGNKKRRDSKVS